MLDVFLMCCFRFVVCWDFCIFHIWNFEIMKCWKAEKSKRCTGKWWRSPQTNLQTLGYEFHIYQKTWNKHLLTFLFLALLDRSNPLKYLFLGVSWITNHPQNVADPFIQPYTPKSSSTLEPLQTISSLIKFVMVFGRMATLVRKQTSDFVFVRPNQGTPHSWLWYLKHSHIVAT